MRVGGRFLDPSTLTRAERIVALAAWLGVINAAIPWWYRVSTAAGRTVQFSAGIDWTGLVAWGCFGLAGVLVLVRAWIWPEPAPHRDGAIYLLLGIVALVSLSVQSFTQDDAWLGFFVGVLLAGLLALGGATRRRERGAGWR